ncbi:MAG: hypothetical protein Q7S21_03050 [archaeon]|nr:hypothetical protein [archaeon]
MDWLKGLRNFLITIDSLLFSLLFFNISQTPQLTENIFENLKIVFVFYSIIIFFSFLLAEVFKYLLRKEKIEKQIFWYFVIYLFFALLLISKIGF